jgi:hypothetical protein
VVTPEASNFTSASPPSSVNSLIVTRKEMFVIVVIPEALTLDNFLLAHI